MKRVYIAGIFIVFFFSGFFFCSNLASADTVISGEIASDTTWSPSDGVYIINSSFSVAAGVTLTIEPGTVIKSQATDMGGPSVYGNIVAEGTADLPIYFTSIYDDSIGGDTDGNGPSDGTLGEWQGLYFKPDSHGTFEHVDISHAGYGGYGYGDHVGIENDGGTLDISNSNIHDNFVVTSNGAGGSMSVGNGILNKSGALLVSDCVVDNNVFGIRVDSGTTTISNTILKNNVDSTGYSAGYGIYALGPEPLTLLNNTFFGNRRTAYVDASKDFTHSGNISDDQSNKGFEINGALSEDTTFRSGDLPYIIGGLIIPEGKTLTLEPETILKMNDRYSSGAITVNGNLIAEGVSDKKIYITSLKDDSVGGDTNGDGGETMPAAKDWSSIFLESGSKAEFDNVTVSYGEYNYNGEYLNIAAAIYQRGAQFTASNSIFEHNFVTDIFQDAGITDIASSELISGNYGIWSRGGSIKISQSSLSGNTSLAIYNESGSTVDARNNWWGSPDGPNDISTSTPTGAGDKVSGDVSYVPFLTDLPAPEKTIDPVIIIPGIMGSAYKNGKLLIDPILHTYDDLIATLKANGYTEGKDLFTFPYEWRDSNVLTANLLKDKINEIKTICQCDKVDIVAHSMGGLAAREYIQSGQYQNDVDQIIFLGTPHKGSPAAYLRWEAGEFGTDFYDSLTKKFFEIEALEHGYFSLFSYVQDRPISSVKELLPVFDYLKDKNTGNLKTYPNGYPRNIFLEYLNNDVSKLLNSGVQITNVVGNAGEMSTINIIRVASSTNSFWIDGMPDGFKGETGDRGLEKGSGDGTVPTNGNILDSSIQNQEISGDHQRLPTLAEANIYSILTNKTASTTFNHNYVIDLRVLLLQLLSPVDMLVIAPDGKRMGKNFQTGEEYNEIPGAFYSGYQTDEEYITILNPLDGEYKVEVQGTDNGGKFGIDTSYISDSSSVSKEYSDNIEPGEIKETSVITGGNENNLFLEIKTKGESASGLIPNSLSSRSGSKHHEVEAVLGANTAFDDQIELQIKFIICLNEMIRILHLYMLQY